MEELVAILIGAGIVALMPLVPALRPVVKTAVKGGLLVADKTKNSTGPVRQHWREVVDEAKMEIEAGGQAEGKISSEAETVKADAEATQKPASRRTSRSVARAAR